MEQETIQIASDIEGIDPAELKEQLEKELAGSGIELQLRRGKSADRFDFGLIVVILTAAAKLAPLVSALAAFIQSRRQGGQIRLLAADDTTILEVPANTSTERIEELLSVLGKNKTVSEIRVG